MKSLKLSALALTTALIAACSSNPSKWSDGQIQEYVFPDLKSATMKQSGTVGTFVDIEQLKLLTVGMSAKQVQALVGHPHFGEGIMGVKEWDYAFNFKNQDGSTRICQMKVVFDGDKRAKEFKWKEPQCVLGHEMPKPVQTQLVKKRFIVDSDLLFGFGKHKLTPSGYEKIKEIIPEIKSVNPTSLLVVGHTDRIGTDEANQKLSEKRAGDVANLLQNEGFQNVTAVGAGETEPVVACEEVKSSKELKKCLQPNRRVEILVDAVKEEVVQ